MTLIGKLWEWLDKVFRKRIKGFGKKHEAAL